MSGGRSWPALLLGMLASLGAHLALLGLDGGSALPSVGAALPVVLVATAVDPAAMTEPAPPVTSPAGMRPMPTCSAAPLEPAPSAPEPMTPEPMTPDDIPLEAGAAASAEPASSLPEPLPATAGAPCEPTVAAGELSAEGAAPAAAPSVAGDGSTAVPEAAAGEVPSVRVAPRYRFAPLPPYPALARSRGWQGEVELWVHVAADGRVLEARVNDSSGFELLDRAAVDTVGRWRFHPARIGKTPVATEIRVPVCFRLPH